MRVITMLLIVLGCTTAYAEDHSPAKAAGGDTGQFRCATTEDSNALSRISELWKSGYNDGNAGRVASLYAEDAYYLTQHFVTGIVHGREAIRAYVQNGIDARYHVDSIEVITTGCSDDFAYTVTRYESTNAGQRAFGVNVVVLRKIGGRWLIVAHESAVPDPSTAIQRLDVPGVR